jgi:hypothetical protein
MILGKLKRTFIKIQAKTFKKLYSVFIRPQMEFAVPVWAPYLKTDIDILEKVQKRAVNWVHFVNKKSYIDKIAEIGIQTLTERRKRGDLIQAFKWFNNIDRIQSDNKPSYNSDKRTRGHSKRYRRELVKTCNSRFNFLLNRVEKDWNNLPVKAVLAPSTSSFKAQIDSFFGWP